MYKWHSLTIAAVAAGAAEAIHHGHAIEANIVPAMLPRDNDCALLPKLCTDHVMLHGVATTLTYLCPEKTQGPSTVHVTVTKTTTVTAARTSNAPTVSVSDDASTSEESTTTTTVKSTLTQYKTVTVSRASAGLSPSLTLPLITNEFTAILPSPSSTPLVSTSEFLLFSPVSTLTPPAITWSFTEGSPTILGGRPTATVGNRTSNVTCTRPAGNSSTVAPMPYFPNITSESGYAAPTLLVARGPPADTATGMASQHGNTIVFLLLGLMAVVITI